MDAIIYCVSCNRYNSISFKKKKNLQLRDLNAYILIPQLPLIMLTMFVFLDKMLIQAIKTSISAGLID